MLPTCPRGSQLLSSYTTCGYPCSSGLVALSTDDAFCVGQACPASTQVDASNNSVCWKTPTTKVGACAAGTTEWMPNSCYRDCPAGFRENGQSCLIPTSKRRLTLPLCPYLFTLSGDFCNPSAFLLLVSLALIVCVGYGMTRISCKPLYGAIPTTTLKSTKSAPMSPNVFSTFSTPNVFTSPSSTIPWLAR